MTHIKRITIDLGDDVTPEEAPSIITSVVEKLAGCWALTTAGPIYDGDGKHVANAKVEQLPMHLQLALEKL